VGGSGEGEVSTPQFHENYTLSGSLAFLLLGREWPPTPKDLREAEQICRELGLGSLIDSMPAGLMQMVGETGWQLSNGDKSRIYLARALIQHADLMVLDETFAALDPETAQLAMDSVLRHAPSLACIAHV
jgi:ATP-binding cassette subfamily B protein